MIHEQTRNPIRSSVRKDIPAPHYVQEKERSKFAFGSKKNQMFPMNLDACGHHLLKGRVRGLQRYEVGAFNHGQ